MFSLLELRWFKRVGELKLEVSHLKSTNRDAAARQCTRHGQPGLASSALLALHAARGQLRFLSGNSVVLHSLSVPWCLRLRVRSFNSQSGCSASRRRRPARPTNGFRQSKDCSWSARRQATQPCAQAVTHMCHLWLMSQRRCAAADPQHCACKPRTYHITMAHHVGAKTAFLRTLLSAWPLQARALAQPGPDLYLCVCCVLCTCSLRLRLRLQSKLTQTAMKTQTRPSPQTGARAAGPTRSRSSRAATRPRPQRGTHRRRKPRR